MQIVPLQPVPNQLVTINLEEQVCKIAVYDKGGSLFFDLQLNNVPVVVGVLCENLNALVRSIYLGFSGDFSFLDNEGNSDPEYTGLGTRWDLAYVTAAELEA